MTNFLNVNTNGNKKLRNTESVRFIIWNLPSIKTCPYATENCKASCYARKAERVYPSVLPSREQNLADSKRDNFTERMIATLVHEVESKKCQGKKVVVRIHESGDFYNKSYADKWLAVAEYMTRYSNVVFMAYTKSLPYFQGKKLPTNFVLRASVWDDTKAERLLEIEKNQYPIYTAFTKIDMTKALECGYTKCNCDDCGNCGKCWDKSINKLACEIH